MGLLNRLFGSTETIAKNLNVANESLIKCWEEYYKTVPEKGRIANAPLIDVPRFKELLHLEIIDLHEEEKDEEEVINDLESIKHTSKINRIHRLEQTLDYAETKYKYAYDLLKQIYSILIAESHLIRLIEKSKNNNEKLISHLKNQIELELLIIGKIKKLDERGGPTTFNELFLDLIKGEHVIEQLDKIAKWHLKKMDEIFSNEIQESITYRWVQGVLDSINDKVSKAIEDGILHYHHDMDFEFVNRPMFVDLVREKIKSLKPERAGGRDVSERMIGIFVHLFREGWNKRKLE